MSGINNAQDLVDQLYEIAETHGVELKDLEVNFRQDFDSDIHAVNWMCECTYDKETSSKLESVVLYNDDTDGDE